MGRELDGRRGRLIILSGEAGAGKDSVADVLVAQHGYFKFLLSDEMKRFAERVFGWPAEKLWGPSRLRNEADPRWARPCPTCGGSGTDYSYSVQGCSTCDGVGKINDNSPRRVLQLLGDEWGRQMIHPDIWTMSAESRIRQLLWEVPVVVSDARFDNDRNNLAFWFGGARVDVRPATDAKKAKKDEAWRRHASETNRPNDDQLDYVLVNDEEWPFPSLQQKVATMLERLKALTYDG